MPDFEEGALNFSFPDGWTVLKFDECNFHSKKWCNFADGCKGVDFIACGGGVEIWLIEVKDYRRERRTKPTDLFDELAQKVRDSLAGLKVLAYQSADSDDKELAQRILNGSGRFRVVLHLEQPDPPSKLFPQVVPWPTASDALKRKLRLVDPRGLVGNQNMLSSKVDWQVSPAGAGG